MSRDIRSVYIVMFSLIDQNISVHIYRNMKTIYIYMYILIPGTSSKRSLYFGTFVAKYKDSLQY